MPAATTALTDANSPRSTAAFAKAWCSSIKETADLTVMPERYRAVIPTSTTGAGWAWLSGLGAALPLGGSRESSLGEPQAGVRAHLNIVKAVEGGRSGRVQSKPIGFAPSEPRLPGAVLLATASTSFEAMARTGYNHRDDGRSEGSDVTGTKSVCANRVFPRRMVRGVAEKERPALVAREWRKTGSNPIGAAHHVFSRVPATRREHDGSMHRPVNGCSTGQVVSIVAVLARSSAGQGELQD